MENVEGEGTMNFVLAVDDNGKKTRATSGILYLLLDGAVFPNDNNVGKQVNVLQSLFHHVCVSPANP